MARFLTGLMIMTLACGPAGDSPPQTASQAGDDGVLPRHVFLVLIDTLRADHLGSYGYPLQTSPTLDRLAKDGLVFTNSFSASSNTLESVTALLFSRHPVGGPYDQTGPERDKVLLQTAFKDAGFKTYGVVANPWLEVFKFFQKDFDHYQQLSGWSTNSTDLISGYVEELIANQLDPDEKSFFYLHYLDPHDPYKSPQQYDSLEAPRPESPRTAHYLSQIDPILERASRDPSFSGRPIPVDVSEQQIRFLIGQYDQEIRYLDDRLGAILDLIKERGILESSLIVVTSDHGEEFGEHDLFKHGFQLYDESIRVPLILHWPDGIEPGRRTDVVGSVDVGPTLLALSGIRPVESMAGRNVLANGTTDRPLLIATHFVNQTQIGMRTPSFKIIEDRANNEISIYDLERDPGELENLFQGDKSSFEELFRQFETLVGASGSLDELSWPDADEMDTKTRERLEALGYL